MIGLGGNIPVGTENGVFALFAVLADPAATKTMLENLVAIRDEASNKLDAVLALSAEADAKAVGIQKREADLDRREKILFEKEQMNEEEAKQFAIEVITEKADLAVRNKAVSACEVRQKALQEDIAARMDIVVAREAETEAAALSAQTLKSQYEDALSKLRALVPA